ncbi:MAG TPA: LytTR family DNA-binding domain-containing protein [Terracidiphilus sp.]|jgi:two-component system LytT family response regulator
MDLRAVIVDDMELARKRLVRQLSRHPDIEIIAECANGDEAVHAIQTRKPDLVFLDVQMPEQDGFAVVGRLGEQDVPEIIFVTAYDQFALKAFDVHAVDYLLKPFSSDRLDLALNRVRRKLAHRTGQIDPQIAELVRSIKGQVERTRPIMLKVDGNALLIRQAEIDWIESAGNYVKVHAGKDGYMIRETMSDFEQRLDQQAFVRVHRCTIVNIARIREIRPSLSGNYQLILRDGHAVVMSRTYRPRLTALVGEL